MIKVATFIYLQRLSWVAAGEDVVKVELPKDVKLERANNMAEMEEEFVKGTIHALFVSRLPRPFLEGNPNVGRFFDEPQIEEERYLRDEGYFPIMHVLAFRRDLSERYPELPMALFELFEQARQQDLKRWTDPNWSMLLWGRCEIERQREIVNFDPWRNGLEPNRKNIERFALYSYEQGLSRRQWRPDELFVPINSDE